METQNMLYIVSEYATNGEMFGEFEAHSHSCLFLYVCILADLACLPSLIPFESYSMYYLYYGKSTNLHTIR